MFSLSTLLSSVGAKVAAGTLVVATAAGGAAAATGHLPPEAQAAVASIAEKVNIQLPRPAGHGGAVTDQVFQDGVPMDADQQFGEGVAGTASEGTSDQSRRLADQAESDSQSLNPSGYGPGSDGSEFQPDDTP